MSVVVDVGCREISSLTLDDIIMACTRHNALEHRALVRAGQHKERKENKSSKDYDKQTKEGLKLNFVQSFLLTMLIERLMPKVS